jgi:uncharacterized RDD family membrane protein YckC
MHEPFWHYTDIQGTEHGPVPAEAARAAIAAGEVGPASQFWREGLPGWIDLSSAAAELGVAAGPASPPDPYAAPRAQVAVVEGTFVASGDVVPAGFVRRFAALFLDQLILAVPLFALAMLLGLATGLSGRANAEPNVAFVLLFYLLWFVVLVLYYAGQESSVHQATLGKRALGIKVTDRDGRRLSFAHAVARWFAASLSYLTFYIGFLMAAFTERKTALHDLVSGTQVVDRWAYSASPERQQRQLSGCLIAAMVGMIAIPFLLAMFAAIAVSQFQEYQRRAQSSGALEGAAPAVAGISGPAVDRRPARCARGAGSSSTPTPS